MPLRLFASRERAGAYSARVLPPLLPKPAPVLTGVCSAGRCAAVPGLARRRELLCLRAAPDLASILIRELYLRGYRAQCRSRRIARFSQGGRALLHHRSVFGKRGLGIGAYHFMGA